MSSSSSASADYQAAAQQFRVMGFLDERSNRNAWRASGGRVDVAIELLLEFHPPSDLRRVPKSAPKGRGVAGLAKRWFASSKGKAAAPSSTHMPGAAASSNMLVGAHASPAAAATGSSVVSTSKPKVRHVPQRGVWTGQLRPATSTAASPTSSQPALLRSLASPRIVQPGPTSPGSPRLDTEAARFAHGMQQLQDLGFQDLRAIRRALISAAMDVQEAAMLLFEEEEEEEESAEREGARKVPPPAQGPAEAAPTSPRAAGSVLKRKSTYFDDGPAGSPTSRPRPLEASPSSAAMAAGSSKVDLFEDLRGLQLLSPTPVQHRPEAAWSWDPAPQQPAWPPQAQHSMLYGGSEQSYAPPSGWSNPFAPAPSSVAPASIDVHNPFLHMSPSRPFPEAAHVPPAPQLLRNQEPPTMASEFGHSYGNPFVTPTPPPARALAPSFPLGLEPTTYLAVGAGAGDVRPAPNSLLRRISNAHLQQPTALMGGMPEAAPFLQPVHAMPMVAYDWTVARDGMPPAQAPGKPFRRLDRRPSLFAELAPSLSAYPRVHAAAVIAPPVKRA